MAHSIEEKGWSDNIIPPKVQPSKTHILFNLVRKSIIFACCVYAISHIWDTLSTRLWTLSKDQPPVNINQDIDWSTIPTLPHLEYKSCYDNFQCARLELPLDYWNGTTDKTISLAIVKLPAVVPVSDPRYGGPVLINPGGPGGSGVILALWAGKTFQSVIDAHTFADEDGKFYDIIGFDPRGVGLSEPTPRCFSDDGLARSWSLRTWEEGTLTSSDAALGRLWSMVHAVGQSCSTVEDDDIKHFVSTASVARDMLGIIEAHGAWREKEATRLSRGRQISSRLSYRPGKELLQYMGFSYGTYLGATFAALFPDRVGRMMLDGVVDAEDYTANLWYDNLVDTEKDVNLFYHHCNRVGYPACALAVPGGSAADVEKRVKKIIDSTYHNPFPVSKHIVDVVSWSDVRSVLITALYSPIQLFPYVAELLAELESGEAESFARLLGSYHSFSCPNPNTTTLYVPGRDPSTQTKKVESRLGSAAFPSNTFSQFAILCGDGDSSTHLNKSDYLDYMKSLQTLSPTIGDIWAGIRLQCVGYPLRPHYRFTGPWQATTSHPILWIGNTADPVTPVGSAHKMAKGYPGSVVLTQDSPGHCSLNAYSACTVSYIHEYFQTGQLPPEGVICQPDVVPFGPGPEDVKISAEIQEKIEMHSQLAQGWYEAGGGLMRGPLMGRIDPKILFS